MSQHPQMTAYLASARWFAGKGRDYEVVEVERVGTLPGPPEVTIELVTVRYPGVDGAADGSGAEAATAEIYQMPLSHYTEPQDRLGHALVGPHDDDELGSRWVYDAVHDRTAMAVYLAAFAGTPAGGEHTYGGITFHRLTDHELDLEASASLFSGEQSNSSVAFGEDSLLKVFRKVTPGRNPDIEIHRALTEAGSESIAALYGWIEAGSEHREPLDLGLIQEFLRTAADGWDLALSSARALFADTGSDIGPDGRPTHPEGHSDLGGDFTGEAERLGAAVHEVHEVLRATFPVQSWDAADLVALAEAMEHRLDAALLVVPELAGAADAARTVFARVADLDLGGSTTGAQRVHGDLHLGQTLRVVHHWKLVDFEGEPAKPLAERVLPDSVWRDVAGMLRSFDYAARTVERDFTTPSFGRAPDGPIEVSGTTAGTANDAAANDDAALDARASQWTDRNRTAFVTGYLGGREITPAEQVLLDAYEADKAVYEVVYEARNRPSWLPIPLGALTRLAARHTRQDLPHDPAQEQR